MISTALFEVSTKSVFNRVLATVVTLAIIFSSFSVMGVVDIREPEKVTDSGVKPLIPLQVTSPSGGEMLGGGDVLTIQWDVLDVGLLAQAPFDIRYTVDGGSTWVLLGIAESGEDSYEWKVPYLDSRYCYIKVETLDKNGFQISASSDYAFSIDSTLPAVRVLRPNGYEIWQVDSVQNIEWTVADDVSFIENVDILYSVNGGLDWIMISENEPNDGSYSWTVPEVNSVTCQVRVEAADEAGNWQHDRNDFYFTIRTALNVIDPIPGNTPMGPVPDEEGRVKATAVDHVVVAPDPATVVVGNVQHFTATAFDENNTEIPGATFFWTTDVGVVNFEGNFTAQTIPGTGIVSATYMGVTGSANVDVVADVLKYILITPDPVSLQVGQSLPFSAAAYDIYYNVIPGVGFDWSTDVGSIDGTGFFTAQTLPGAGYVTATNGTITGQAYIEVLIGSIDRIDVSPDTASLQVAETQIFTAEAYDSFGNVITGTVFAWSTNVGSVDASGFFTAQTIPGSGFVNATSGGVTGTATVDVTLGPLDHIEVLPDAISLTVGETQLFTATAYDEYMNVISGVGFTWTTDVGSVDATGFYTAQTQPGTGQVRANNGSITGISDVTVLIGELDHIEVVPDPATVQVGAQQQFTALAHDIYHNVISGVGFLWSTDAGTIDSAGLFTAQIVPGSGQVTAWNGTHSGSATVSVIGGAVDHIELTPDTLTIKVGETQQFTAIAYDSYNNVIPDAMMFWTTTAGVVNSTGFFTAQTVPGTGFVNVTSGAVTAYADVTVLIGDIFHILVSPGSATVVVGASRSFTAAAYDAYFNLITGVGFDWSTDIGTVDATGYYTAQTISGIGVVSATNGSVTGNSDITVIPDVIDHITISPDPGTVMAGATLQFNAVAFDQYDNAIPGVDFEWSTDVGSVDSNGLMTAQTTVATGSILAVNNSVTGSAVVLIVPGGLDHIIVTPNPYSIKVGQTRQFIATGYDMYGNAITGMSFSWTTDVGIVSTTGFFIAQTTPDVGYVQAKNGSVSGVANVVVLVGDVDHIAVSPSPSTVVVGGTRQFSARAYDQFNNIVPGLSFMWSTNLGIVNSTGYFTAYTTAKVGTVNARYGTVTGSANVEVVAGALDHIVVTPSPVSVVVGTSQAFTAVGYDIYNNIKNNVTYYWSTNVGVVNYQGIFIAQTSIGSGFVRATSGSIIGSAAVTVIPGPCYRIVVTPNPVTMTTDGEKQFYAAGYDVYNNVISMTPTWEVNGGGTIDGSGYFTADTVGTWRVFANYSGVSGSAVINIMHGIPVAIDITPPFITITADDTVSYTATAYDAGGNPWDVTPDTAFVENDPWGYMDGNIYNPGQAGTWTVVGNYGGLTDFATVVVNPGAAAQVLLDSPPTVTAGDVFSVTVTIYDSDGNVKTDYLGTIGLSSSDPYPAILPPDHIFTGPDSGTFMFTGLTLYTWPEQYLNATDTGNSSLEDSDLITVISPFIQPSKVVQPTAEPGDVITYYIHYNNTGDTVASHVWLNDTLPPGTTFISASNGGVEVGNSVRWHLTDVLPGLHFVWVTVELDLGLPDGYLINNWVFCNYTSENGHQFQETWDNATVRIFYLPVINVSKTVEIMLNDITVDPDQWGDCSKGYSIPYFVNVTNLQPVADSIDMTYDSLLDWDVEFQQPGGGGFPLPDTNGNGIPDTGTLAANGGKVMIVVNITVPQMAEKGTEDITYVTGTSYLNPNVIDIARINTTVTSGGPKEVVLVLDTSGSMDGQPLYDLKQAANQMVDDLDESDYVALINFDYDQPRLVQGMVQMTPPGRTLTKSRINAMVADSWTPIWDAIWDGVSLADISTGITGNTPVVVAITDGEDTSSGNNYYRNDDYSEMPDGDVLGRQGLPDGNFRDDYGDPYDPSGDGDGGICEVPFHVFTIGLSVTTQSQYQLQEVGRTSDGGEYYFAPTSSQLDEIFEDISGAIAELGGNNSYGSKEMISAGDSLLYKIYYNNTGLGEAGDVWVNDSLPSTLILLDTNASVPYTYVNGQYSWHFQDVLVGTHWFWIEVEINNTVVSGEEVVNEVLVEYTDAEGNSMPSSSDDASVTISEPNIDLQKVASKSTVEPGEIFTYTIHYNNTGDAMALFIWINDTFDPRLSVISHTAPVTPNIVGNSYSWKIPGVLPGEYSFNVTVQVDGGIPGGTDIVNEVFADYTNEDNVRHSTPSHSECTVIVDNTRIDVVKTPDKSYVNPLEILTYTVYFNNTGGENAFRVWINETIPNEVSYLSDTSTTSPTSSPYFFSRQIAGKDIRYVFQNVPAGPHSFIIRVRINPGVPDGTEIVNHINLDCTDKIGIKMPSSAYDALTICGPLKVTKTRDKSLIPVGTASDVRLTIHARNVHDFLNLTSVNVTDTLPLGVTWVGNVYTSDGTWSWDGSQLVWNIETIPPSTTLTLSFDVSVTPGSQGLVQLNNGAPANGYMEATYFDTVSNAVYTTAVIAPLLDAWLTPSSVISSTTNSFSLFVTNVGTDGLFYNDENDLIELTIPDGWGIPYNIGVPANWGYYWVASTRTLTFHWPGITDYVWNSGNTEVFTFDIMAPVTQGEFTFPVHGSIHNYAFQIWDTNMDQYVMVGVGPVDYIIVSPDPVSLVVGGTQSFEAEAFDVYGNLIPDAVFTWNSDVGTVDEDGSFTAGTLAATGFVDASYNAVSGFASVTVLPGAFHHITVTPQLPIHIPVAGTQQFTATAYDVYNNPIPGIDFDWTTNVGSVDDTGFFTAQTTASPGIVRATNGTLTDFTVVILDPGPKDHILITPDPLTITVGATQTFVATAYDMYGNPLSGIDFTWVTDMGTIDASGFFTAQTTPGTGLVSATNDTLTGYGFVEVILGELDHIIVLPDPAIVRVGKTMTFTATGYDIYNNIIPGLTFTWATDVGSINSGGFFTAQYTPDTGYVSATSGSVTGTAVVDVIPGIINYIVIAPNPVTVIVGTTQAFTATAYDVYSNPIPGVAFDWATNVGIIDQNGLLTVQTTPGNGQVTATNGTVSGISIVSVIVASVDHISVSPDPATVPVGSTQLFVATAYDAFDNPIAGISFTWLTDAGSIDSGGLFTAQTTPTSGIVTAMYNTISADAQVEVVVGAADHIQITPDTASVTVGEYRQFSAAAYDEYDNLIPDAIFLWTTDVGVVNSTGYFTAQTAPGIGWVNATSGGVTGSAYVEVMAEDMAYIIISPASVDVTVGGSQMFTATAYDLYDNAIPGVVFEWSTDVGSIDAFGLFTAQTTPGTGYVTVTNGTFSDTASVNVVVGEVDHIVIVPNMITINVGGTKTFTAIGFDSFNNVISGIGFDWTTDVGSVDQGGFFTAQTTPATGTVTASNGTYEASAMVYIVPGPVDSISLMPDPVSVVVGTEQQFTATAYDSYGNVITGAEFDWTSDVGSIDADGLFAAQSTPGSGFVGAANGTVSAFAAVSVTVGELDHIAINPDPVTITVGQSQSFSALAYDYLDNVIPGVVFVWTSDVGTIDAAGFFTAQTTPAIGVVTATNGTTYHSATVTILPGAVDHIEVTPVSVNVIVGGQQQFTATAYDIYNNAIPGVGLDWNTDVGIVDGSGLFTAQSVPGSGTISATNGTISGLATIEVVDVIIDHIIVLPDPVSVTAGAIQSFTATAYDQFNNAVAGVDFVWSTDVGAIDPSGLLVAQTFTGSGTVTATNGTVSGFAAVDIVPGPLDHIIVLPNPVSVVVGLTEPFSATAFDVYSNVIPGVVFDWGTDVGSIDQSGLLIAQTTPATGSVTATNGSVSGFAAVDVTVGTIDHITVMPAIISLNAGTSQSFSATAYDAYNNVVPGVVFQWTTDIGSVDVSGFFTAQTVPGVGVVTATNGTVSRSATVNVIPGPVDHITVVPDYLLIEVGQSLTFTAIAFDSYGNVVPDLVFTWATTVGTIDAVGQYTAQTNTGSGTVTASYGAVEGLADVVVKAGAVDHIAITPDPATITVGESLQFTATAFDIYGNIVTGTAFTWTTSAGAVDQNGFFTAQTWPGLGGVTARYGAISETADVEVVVGSLDHITIFPITLTITVGDTQSFLAFSYDKYDNFITGVDVTWATDVGSIDTAGIYTAQTVPGTGVVTATNGTVMATASVEVVAGALDHIIVTPDPVIVTVGESQAFVATCYDAYDNTLTGIGIDWSTDIGTIDASGTFTAQTTPGACSVTARNGTVSDSATVNVFFGALDHIIVTPDPVMVNVGDNQAFTAVGYDVYNNAIPGVEFTWWTDVGSVDATGSFTAQTIPGTGTVTATNGTVSDSATVTVIPGPVDHIVVTPDPVTVLVNAQQQFTATAHDVYDNEITGVTFLWTTDAGSVDATGLFTAQAIPGTGTVTARNETVFGTAGITVAYPIVKKIVVNPNPVTVQAGGTRAFTATAYDQFNNVISGVTFIWTTNVGSITSGGVLTAQTSVGTGTVTARNGTVNGFSLVNVVPGSLDHIQVFPGSVSVTAGGTKAFSAVGFDVYNNVKSGLTFTWTTDVGAIDASGFFTAQTTTATGYVSAQSGAITGYASVTVIPGPIDNIMVSPDPASIIINGQQIFNAEAYDTYGNLVPGISFSWSTNVGTIDEHGLFTAQPLPGTGYVMAMSGLVSGSATVNVVNVPISRIVVSPDPATVPAGETLQFTATAYDMFKNVILGVDYVWTTNIGLVDSSGLLISQTTPEVGYVRATNGTFSDSATVEVVPGAVDRIVLVPNSLTLSVGQSYQFIAVAFDAYNNAIGNADFVWATDVGSIDDNGQFTAQMSPGMGFVSASNGTATGYAMVTVTSLAINLRLNGVPIQAPLTADLTTSIEAASIAPVAVIDGAWFFILLIGLMAFVAALRFRGVRP